MPWVPSNTGKPRCRRLHFPNWEREGQFNGQFDTLVLDEVDQFSLDHGLATDAHPQGSQHQATIQLELGDLQRWPGFGIGSEQFVMIPPGVLVGG